MKFDLKIDLKRRFTNKTFIASFVAVLILLVQQLGLGQYLPENLMEVVNTFLLLLTMLGVVTDPTTDGVSDSQAVQGGLTSDDLLYELQELKEQLAELEVDKNE